jgi:hypothetical protein
MKPTIPAKRSTYVNVIVKVYMRGLTNTSNFIGDTQKTAFSYESMEKSYFLGSSSGYVCPFV